MKKQNIINKLKESGLKGRSGCNFPTGLKWQMVKKAKAEKKYIICNASEGEPNVFKDGFILKNYPEKVVQGIKIALETIDNSSAYIYLRKDYFRKFKKTLEKLTRKLPVLLLKKPDGYLAGEETSILEFIEGKRPEPRIKPPYPTEAGLWGYPTLINNVETFYSVAQINDNQYQKDRFYCLTGEIKNPGVFNFPQDYSISEILKQTNNWPDFDFFVQAGGGAVGEILLPKELNQPINGLASIIVFNRKTDLFNLMEEWADFFLAANCDKCLPCREGAFRIAEIIKKNKVNDFDQKTLADIFFVLKKTSFCPLGRGMAIPFQSLINKLL
jgi:NADH:ubiquinone oxidoreductase subunit F (NADH-binding)